MVTIGKYTLETPPGHQLADIYQSNPTYQYNPWAHICQIVNLNKNLPLVDIGANIGDSAAHYRNFSSGPIYCYEADSSFFKYLQKNTEFMPKVYLHNYLIVKKLQKKFYFRADSQTGNITQKGEAPVYSGKIKTIEELIINLNLHEFLIKTDCDGYDSQLLEPIAQMILKLNLKVPVIFAEGPSEDQIKTKKYKKELKYLKKLFSSGYKLHIYTNRGEFFFTTTSYKDVLNLHEELRIGFKNNSAVAHYFDFIFEKNF